MAEPTILIADDESHILLLVSITLGKDGYRVVEAENGADALELARRERPDVVVLDAAMPRLSGYEVCAALRADPALAPQPFVLMLTAAAREADRRRADDAGVDEFMTKPFSPSQLRSRIREVLAGRVAEPAAPAARD